jgi:hypothetical protein
MNVKHVLSYGSFQFYFVIICFHVTDREINGGGC